MIEAGAGWRSESDRQQDLADGPAEGHPAARGKSFSAFIPQFFRMMGDVSLEDRSVGESVPHRDGVLFLLRFGPSHDFRPVGAPVHHGLHVSVAEPMEKLIGDDDLLEAGGDGVGEIHPGSLWPARAACSTSDSPSTAEGRFRLHFPGVAEELVLPKVPSASVIASRTWLGV